MTVPRLSAQAVKTLLEKEGERLRAEWFVKLCEQNGLPKPEREFRFAAPERQWRFDFCWVEQRVALEVEGGTWTYGRHSRGSGVKRDMEKYNAASLRGYRVLRTTPRELCTAETLDLIREALR